MVFLDVKCTIKTSTAPTAASEANKDAFSAGMEKFVTFVPEEESYHSPHLVPGNTVARRSEWRRRYTPILSPGTLVRSGRVDEQALAASSAVLG